MLTLCLKIFPVQTLCDNTDKKVTEPKTDFDQKRSVRKDYIKGEVDGENLQEESESFKQFVVFSGMDHGRLAGFHFPFDAPYPH